jgi:thymidylate synthase
MYQIRGENIPFAFDEFRWTFRNEAIEESSRNGPVWTIPGPSFLEIYDPTERVLFDAERDANPFFHVMEFVWMMSGSPHVKWIADFNKQMLEYSDDGKTLPQSYGVRWRRHFTLDQIAKVISTLKSDPTSRRAVIAMWDPEVDNFPSKDRPCNTTIYFRILQDRLNMLVCNRSNDAIWGMFGANCVHMTLLQELVARAIGCSVGVYSVVTMNLHVYHHHKDLIHQRPGATQDYYQTMGLRTYPILHDGESYQMFYNDCERFVHGDMAFNCKWIKNVALPICQAYRHKDIRAKAVTQIEAQDWRVACTRWMERKHERTHNSGP